MSFRSCPVFSARRPRIVSMHDFPWQGPMKQAVYRFSVSGSENPSAMARSMSASVMSRHRQTKALSGTEIPGPQGPHATGCRRGRPGFASGQAPGERTLCKCQLRAVGSNHCADALEDLQPPWDRAAVEVEACRALAADDVVAAARGDVAQLVGWHPASAHPNEVAAERACFAGALHDDAARAPRARHSCHARLSEQLDSGYAQLGCGAVRDRAFVYQRRNPNSGTAEFERGLVRAVIARRKRHAAAAKHPILEGEAP